MVDWLNTTEREGLCEGLMCFSEFKTGNYYHYEHKQYDVNGDEYYRIFPNYEDNQLRYAVISVKSFQNCFNIITENQPE